MTFYLKNGLDFIVTPDNAVDIHKELPPATFAIKQNPQTGALYLSLVEGFAVPRKLYGDTEKHTTRILTTFLDRTVSTGVLLAGEQGSGKTMLAKNLSIEARKLGIPTILISAPWAGEQFNAFIQQIDQPTVVIFDEFEKIYDAEEQEKMLTLLDGVFPSKKLYVLTCNDEWRINKHMKNRPGRIFYRLDFDGLDEAFIREYAADNLKNSEHTEGLVRAAGMFGAFNFDMLKAVVEDMNRYKEPAAAVMQYLNASPAYSDEGMFDVSIVINDKPLPAENVMVTEWRGNPLDEDDDINLGWYEFVEPDEDTIALDKAVAEMFGDDFAPIPDSGRREKRRTSKYTRFKPEDLAKVEGGAFTFVKGNVKATLKRQTRSRYVPEY